LHELLSATGNLHLPDPAHGVDPNLINEMKGNKDTIIKIISLDEEKRKA